jgi:hypothetical protein
MCIGMPVCPLRAGDELRPVLRIPVLGEGCLLGRARIHDSHAKAYDCAHI